MYREQELLLFLHFWRNYVPLNILVEKSCPLNIFTKLGNNI